MTTVVQSFKMFIIKLSERLGIKKEILAVHTDFKS